MAKQWYEKLHSFRLTKDDEELFLFLSKIPNKKKSETIRAMLLYALAHIEDINDLKIQHSHAKEKGVDYHELLAKLEEIQKEQLSHYEKVINKLEQGIVVQSSNNDNTIDEEKERLEESVAVTANAMLNSFGIDFG